MTINKGKSVARAESIKIAHTHTPKHERVETVVVMSCVCVVARNYVFDMYVPHVESAHALTHSTRLIPNDCAIITLPLHTRT